MPQLRAQKGTALGALVVIDGEWQLDDGAMRESESAQSVNVSVNPRHRRYRRYRGLGIEIASHSRNGRA
jgi:hypothetical protein